MYFSSAIPHRVYLVATTHGAPDKTRTGPRPAWLRPITSPRRARFGVFAPGWPQLQLSSAQPSQFPPPGPGLHPQAVEVRYAGHNIHSNQHGSTAVCSSNSGPIQSVVLQRCAGRAGASFISAARFGTLVTEASFSTISSHNFEAIIPSLPPLPSSPPSPNLHRFIPRHLT